MSNETGKFTEGWKEFFESGEEDSYSSKVIFSVALLIVFVVSCLANVVICIVICCNKTMHTATNYYLFDLAVSDLLVTFPILTMAYQNLSPDEIAMDYYTGNITCNIFVCFQCILTALLWNHGILVITVLSIERYIAICYPFRLQRVPVWKRVVKIILVIWTIAIGETLPFIWTLDIVDIKTELKCVMLATFTARILSIYWAVIVFLIPLGIMVIVYTMIAFRVKNHGKFNLSYRMVNKSIRNGNNVTKLIVALTMSFVVCWLPNIMMNILPYFIDIRTSTHLKWFMTFYKIAIFNSYLTTVVNPILFSLISVKFRKALKELWDKLIKKRVSETTFYGENKRDFSGDAAKIF